MSALIGRLSDGDHAERAVITRLLTQRRLAWCHGEERAAQIIDGKDAATKADLAKWRSLGQGPLTRRANLPKPEPGQASRA